MGKLEKLWFFILEERLFNFIPSDQRNQIFYRLSLLAINRQKKKMAPRSALSVQFPNQTFCKQRFNCVKKNNNKIPQRGLWPVFNFLPFNLIGGSSSGTLTPGCNSKVYKIYIIKRFLFLADNKHHFHHPWRICNQDKLLVPFSSGYTPRHFKHVIIKSFVYNKQWVFPSLKYINI